MFIQACYCYKASAAAEPTATSNYSIRHKIHEREEMLSPEPQVPHQLPIGSQPYESRWSKRAGLHVVHCGPRRRRTRSLEYTTKLVICLPIKGGAVVKAQQDRLEETDGLAHSALDVKGLDVLPVLLEQGDQEVDTYTEESDPISVGRGGNRRTEHDVSENLVLGHVGMANSDAQAQDLFELELDGRTDLRDLGLEIFTVRDGRGELAS